MIVCTKILHMRLLNGNQYLCLGQKYTEDGGPALLQAETEKWEARRRRCCCSSPALGVERDRTGASRPATFQTPYNKIKI